MRALVAALTTVEAGADGSYDSDNEINKIKSEKEDRYKINNIGEHK